MGEVTLVPLKRILVLISPLKNGNPLLFSTDHNFLMSSPVIQFQVNGSRSRTKIGNKKILVKANITEYLTNFTL